jgi:hypothetical protein
MTIPPAPKPVTTHCTGASIIIIMIMFRDIDRFGKFILIVFYILKHIAVTGSGGPYVCDT